ncbi:MAG: hypothetical protein Q4P36_00290 [Bowdeniella nasicola]|nr:hypothetical protein [Bowdeniella nasicola]
MRTGNPGRLLAMRRLLAEPKAAWRNVSALAILGLVAAFGFAMPDNPVAIPTSSTAC